MCSYRFLKQGPISICQHCENFLNYRSHCSNPLRRDNAYQLPSLRDYNKTQVAIVQVLLPVENGEMAVTKPEQEQFEVPPVISPPTQISPTLSKVPHCIESADRTLSSSSTLVGKDDNEIRIKELSKVETDLSEDDQYAPKHAQRPDVRIVKHLLFLFVGFITTLVFVSRFPTGPSWVILLIIGTSTSAGLLLYCVWYGYKHRRSRGECLT